MLGALYGDIAPMSMNDGQGQAESESASWGGAAIVASIESLKNMREVVFVNTDTGIGNSDLHIPRFNLDCYGYHAAMGRVFDGIVQEV